MELPNAPCQPDYFSDVNVINDERNKLIEKKQFFECKLSFSDTSLKNCPEYQDISDNAGPPCEERTYWVYLPSNYNHKNIYPLLLFLDGSDYLNTIPIPSILERLINDGVFPPCVAVFLEYSPDRRLLEYYGDKKFTDFLANDFIKILQQRNNLPSVLEPSLTTIIGLSASGLAAIYAGLTYPNVFGNVLTQSAALWCRKWCDLEKWVDKHRLKNPQAFFCMEAGSFETIPLTCRFEDGFTQAISIWEANKKLVSYMQQKAIKACFHEFVGGHNYVCYRVSIADRLREIYEMRFAESA